MTAVDAEVHARATTYKSFFPTRIYVFFELCDKESTMKEKTACFQALEHEIQRVVMAWCFADVT
jgi:pyrimidine deaminase RibD-like protein